MPRFQNSRGMTLVELMVAIGVTLMVMALTVSIFTGQYKSHIKRGDVNEIQESTPPAIELLKRDLMSAGWSVRPEMGFYFEDGGSNGSDRIYVNDSTIIDENHSGEISKFMKEECSGCLQTGVLNHLLRLDTDTETAKLDIDDEEDDDDASGKDFVKSVYQFIITSSSEHRVVRLGDILFENWYGVPVLYNTADTPSLVGLNPGTFVTPGIYYCVDDGNSSQCHPNESPSKWALRRSDKNSSGRQIIAGNVVDLQVAYRDEDNGTWYGATGCQDRSDCSPADLATPIAFDSDKIDLIRVTLITRSAHRDKALTNNSTYCRPAVENRDAAAAGSEECGYTYRTYTIQIVPRNT